MSVYNDIRNCLGQQNFALTATSNPDITVLRNREGSAEIFCVLVDNTGGRAWSASRLLAINGRLVNFGNAYNDVLFIVVTDKPQRDEPLAAAQGMKLWLADERERMLLVFENQPEDFYGLRLGIEETVAEEMYPERKSPHSGTRRRPKTDSLPYVTIILIAVNIVWFVILMLNGSLSDSEYMLRMGANYGVYVFEKFQYWRLITGMFMHFSVSHIAGNMFYLAVAGYNLEKGAGHLKFFLIYMLSGTGASLVSAGYYYLSGTNTISAGASGAVYGLIGAMLFLTYRNRGRIRSSQLFLRFGIILVFLYYSNFSEFAEDGIDGAAHIAGFVFGFLLSAVLLGRRRKKGV